MKNSNFRIFTAEARAQRAFSHHPNAGKGMKIKPHAEFTGINTGLSWFFLEIRKRGGEKSL